MFLPHREDWKGGGGEEAEDMVVSLVYRPKLLRTLRGYSGEI